MRVQPHRSLMISDPDVFPEQAPIPVHLHLPATAETVMMPAECCTGTAQTLMHDLHEIPFHCRKNLPTGRPGKGTDCRIPCRHPAPGRFLKNNTTFRAEPENPVLCSTAGNTGFLLDLLNGEISLFKGKSSHQEQVRTSALNDPLHGYP